MSFDLNTALRESIGAHGIRTELAGEWVSAPDSDLLIAAHVVRITPQQDWVNIQVDFRVRSSLIGSRLFIESFGGVGKDEDEAARYAFGRFLQGSLHVLLAVLVGTQYGGNQVEWEMWSDGVNKWHVCLGAMQVHGFSAVPEGLVIGSLLDDLEGRLLPGLSNGLHWLRIFHFKLPSSPPISEALLDNEDWAYGREAVGTWPWPEGGYSVRQFMMLIPAS